MKSAVFYFRTHPGTPIAFQRRANSARVTSVAINAGGRRCRNLGQNFRRNEIDEIWERLDFANALGFQDSGIRLAEALKQKAINSQGIGSPLFSG